MYSPRQSRVEVDGEEAGTEGQRDGGMEGGVVILGA